jgi:glycosyltransferase involved in cell wall biosynthesis
MERGEMVVCIPVYGGHEQFVPCLESVLAHTPADTPILVCDDASPDRRSQDHVRALQDRPSEHELLYLRRERNVGFPVNVNGAFASAAPADVVVLNSDCVVAEGWLEGLRAAAYSDSSVATASALSNHASVLSVPGLTDLPEPAEFARAASAVRDRSLRLRPRLLTAIGHCMYVRRSALELVGGFDPAFSPGYGEEVDFSQRCLQMSLCHVAADDVLVLHHGGVSLSVDGAPNPVKRANERRIADRYPYYHEAVRTVMADATGPLARSLGAARRALSGLSVVIDARILDGPMTGTQLHVLELLTALTRTGEARVMAIVPRDLTPDADRALRAVPQLDLLRAEAVVSAGVRADVVHRPFQVSAPADLTLLAQVSDRLVVTHQDLISYRNPAYFRSFVDWQGYRELTRRALATADHVVFVSGHARDDALAEQLVEPHRASVVHNGVDHSLLEPKAAPVPPNGAVRLDPDAEVMLCLGTNFRHKNRVFALRVLDELQRRHDWPGRLVLAGPRVLHGSSVEAEAEVLRGGPRLERAVLDVGSVSEAEKAWLLKRASLVIYPTVYEGFGLVPFEAAEHRVPCLWAAGTALDEVLSGADGGIVAWDVAATADRALRLMRDAGAREANVQAVRRAGAAHSWNAAARRLIEIYHQACAEAPAPVGAWERTRGLMRRGLSDDAIRLVGPDGVLASDFERPLLALATHPQIGRPVLRAIRAGYLASARLRRLSGRRAAHRVE